MQILQQQSEISKVLYYVQRFGDLSPKLITALSGIKEATKIIENLKEKYKMLPYPIERADKLNLKRYYVEVYFSKNIDLLKLYEAFNGITVAINRDMLNDKKYIIGIMYSKNADFIRGLEYLVDIGLIHYYELYEEEEKQVYPIDYSTFDFEKGKFSEDFIKNPRQPFELPDLSDNFKPDEIDIKILGKKQEQNDFTLKDISSSLGIPFKEVLYHYQAHVVGRGLISAYHVFLGKFDFKMSLIYDSDEEVDNALSRIPTLISISHLSDNTSKATLVAQSHMLYKILEFITRIQKDSKISFTIHPLFPPFEYSLTASIPYEHFNKKWEFNVEELLMKEEEILS
ncbi:AsnC family protein [Acidianus brierleyi]|uniref:AsnC family protein n=1 Tax=Acidianus brierleyi TaxID=41673 RepID=A0A2U9IHB5_9CREN|nr:AsnC family protein [Acidianus brierleyi]AWR95314.1 AsnC family protein [Acidianus brierleyi]